MDIVFDRWMAKNYPYNAFERYADDIIVHCRNVKEALRLLEAVNLWLKDCKLELNRRLYKWVRNKYKRFKKKSWHYSLKYLQGVAESYPNMFERWKYEGLRP